MPWFLALISEMVSLRSELPLALSGYTKMALIRICSFKIRRCSLPNSAFSRVGTAKGADSGGGQSSSENTP